MELNRRALATSRYLALALALSTCLPTSRAHAGDYVLEIDGRQVELDLNHSATAVLSDGKTTKLLLRQKTEQTWHEDGASFTHPAAFTPARRELSKNITQTIMATPSGSIVLVQHYIGLDPTTLIDVMINKLSDDEVQAGYQRTIKKAQRKLGDGVTLAGKIVHTEHPGEAWDREVVAIGDHDGGFLVVGATSDSSTPADFAMIDAFWRSLRLSIGGRAEPLE